MRFKASTTDSTIAPPRKNSDFLERKRFVAARYDEGCYEKYIFTHVFVREGLSTDDVGVAKGTVFQEIRPRAGFKTGDFIHKKSWGGYRRTTPADPTTRLAPRDFRTVLTRPPAGWFVTRENFRSHLSGTPAFSTALPTSGTKHLELD